MVKNRNVYLYFMGEPNNKTSECFVDLETAEEVNQNNMLQTTP